jgi:hypothetical protein
VNIPPAIWGQIETVVESRGITPESESQLIVGLLEEWLRFSEDRALGAPGKSLEVKLQREVARLDSEITSLKELIQAVTPTIRTEEESVMKNGKQKALVLIDAENTPVKYFDALKRALEGRGYAPEVRIYANSFKTGVASPWAAVEGATQCWNERELPYYDADRHLSYDAAYLAAKPYDAIVLVSSDSDFRQLVSHLQEDEIKVLGFGEKDKCGNLEKAYKKGEFTRLEDVVGGSKKQVNPLSALKERVIKPVFQQLRGDKDYVLASRFGDEFWKLLAELKDKYPELQEFADAKLKRIVELTGGEVLADRQKELVRYYRWSF